MAPTRTAKAQKAACAAHCHALEQLPDVGPALAADLRLIGIQTPAELKDQNALVLYRQLNAATGLRNDPCVLDTFMAITDFMRGAAPTPWWHYTAQRKARFGPL